MNTKILPALQGNGWQTVRKLIVQLDKIQATYAWHPTSPIRQTIDEVKVILSQGDNAQPGAGHPSDHAELIKALRAWEKNIATMDGRHIVLNQAIAALSVQEPVADCYENSKPGKAWNAAYTTPPTQGENETIEELRAERDQLRLMVDSKIVEVRDLELKELREKLEKAEKELHRYKNRDWGMVSKYGGEDF